MPLAIIIIGALLAITAVKGNYQAVGTQFNTTFFGDGTNKGFLVWFGSILGIAVVFRLINAPKAGNAFIALLILVYLIQHSSVLSALSSVLNSGVSTSGASSAHSNAIGVTVQAKPATPAVQSSPTADTTDVLSTGP